MRADGTEVTRGEMTMEEVGVQNSYYVSCNSQYRWVAYDPAIDARAAAISKLAQAIDNAEESGFSMMDIAAALSEAAWRTHGIDADGNGANAHLNDDDIARGTDDFTEYFMNAVRHG
jgi:hypothetical protein